jgi:DNA-binding CsgD family transcriptional regulator
MDLLRRVLGDGAEAAVDEAVAKGVLTPNGPRVQPTHPLFASTAYADALPGERRALRQALADATDDPVERAIHLAAMIERPDDGIADALASAARLAAGRGAPGIAANLFERAAQTAAAEGLRNRCLIDAAEAALASGDPTRAAARLRVVLNEVPTGRLRAEALLALGEIVYVEQPHEALDLLVAALEHTEGDPVLEATAHAYIASMADMNPLAGQRSALAAVEILGRPGVVPEPDQLACALLDRAFHWLLAGKRVAVDDIDRGIELMRGTGTSFFVRRGQEVAERCLFHLGRLADATAMDEAEHRRLTEGGQLGLLPPLDQSLSVLHLMAGDWPAARRYAQECMDLVDGGEEMWSERALTARARILAWEGDLDAARSIAVEALGRQEAAADRWEATIFCALLGFIELSIPNPPEALAYLTRGLAHADAMEVKLPTQFRFLGDLVEAAVLVGDLDLAERVLHERLEESATRLPLPWTQAMAARGRGLLEAAQRDLDSAIGHFDLAVDIFTDELPMPFECARTQLGRGQVHRRGGQRRAAREDVVTAQGTFEALGARVWARRATEELGRIGGRASSGNALTASERAVAELAAEGRSNREIAAELVVSVRTVESQLSAAYRKLGIGSRGLLRNALADRSDVRIT